MKKKIVFTVTILMLIITWYLCGEYSFTTPYKFDELGWGAGNNTRGEKCIAIYGTNVYIGAEANGVSGTIQFYRSTNSGTSWETLEEPGWSDSRYPSLSIDEGGRLYITWFYHNATYTGLCKTGALYGDVFQCTGTGNTWIDWYSDLWFAGCPSISAKGTTEGNPLICASQESFDGTVYYEIVLDCPLHPMSWDNFNYWQNTSHDHYMTYPTVEQIRPCIRLDDGNYVHLIWEDNRASVCRLAYRRSSQVLSSGGTWPLSWNSLVYIDDSGHNTKGSTTGYVQGHSQMFVKGSGGDAEVYVVWVASDNNIYFDKSTDGGTTWGTDIRVNDDISATREWPSIHMDASGNIYVVWMDNRNGNNDIYFSYSIDGGNSFYTDQYVNDGTKDDKYPGIVSGAETDGLSNVHIAWTRVDTTCYVKGTPPLGINEINFVATNYNDGILLTWSRQGYSDGYQWRLSRRKEKEQNFTEIYRVPANTGEEKLTFKDNMVNEKTIYTYKLSLINNNGNILSKKTTSIVPSLIQKKTYIKAIPISSGAVKIIYNLANKENNASIKILDTGGRVVKTFANKELSGSKQVFWNAKDQNNRNVSSGVYFALLKDGKERRTNKFLVIR